MSPMEIVRVISFVQGTLKFSFDELKKHRQLGRDMKSELEKLTDDLDYLKRGLKEEGWESYDELLVTELVYDIEDFSQGLYTPGAVDYLLSAIGMGRREKYVHSIKCFRDRMDKLVTRSKESRESKPEQGGGSDPASSSAPAGGYTREKKSLVGISEPKKVLLDLLKKPASIEEAQKPPRVLSIVGCPGVGKTALARAVYDHYVASAASCDFDHCVARNACASDEFECVAWVEAAGCNDTAALLTKILQKVQADLVSRASHTHLPSEGDGNAASPDLHGILADKRYLVFIDDVQQAKVLKDIIHDHFPENAKSGMVIITTSVHQVANVYSPGSYVYIMKCLDHTESEKLFCRQAFNNTPKGVGRAKLAGSKSIITKCGGLPLALISVAEHLNINATNVDRDYCDKVVKNLGSHLAGSNTKEEFMKLRRVLEQCYEALPNFDHKTYMRSLSIFPRNHPIKCKSLVRRLVAEGLVAGDGRECLDELVNRCIVEPVQNSSRYKDVKACQVNVGIMLEFIIHKSLSTNFVTLIRGEEVVRNPKGRIRRLSVQSSTRDKFQEVAKENKMFETIRSLTIIPSEVISEFSSIKRCKFLRLLDLEEGSELDEEFVRGICKLVYLKYLRLRKTNVKKIPCQIENLRCLQTLDIGNGEIELPDEVMTLPKLAFLLGKFVLPKMSNSTKEFLLTKSELHTVAGFVVDQGKGSEHIILETKNLSKVKVWCRGTCVPPPTSGSHPAASASPNPQASNNDFILSLQSRFTSLDSVSIQSDQLSQDIMASLEGRPCKISRMKLSGKIDRLPTVATLGMINNLSKLHLSYTGLTSEELSMLQHMPCLEYLKLQDNKTNSWDGIFSVLRDGFESLRLLCFEAPKLPKLQFELGSMQSLTSLHLLCGDISQMQVAEEISESIKHITSLNEVMILHSSGTKHTEIVEAWKTAANSSPSRPCVSQLKKQSLQ